MDTSTRNLPGMRPDPDKALIDVELPKDMKKDTSCENLFELWQAYRDLPYACSNLRIAVDKILTDGHEEYYSKASKRIANNLCNSISNNLKEMFEKMKPYGEPKQEVQLFRHGHGDYTLNNVPTDLIVSLIICLRDLLDQFLKVTRLLEKGFQ